MTEQRLKKIIENAKEKAKKNLSIKNDLLTLSLIYDFIKNNDDYKQLVFLMEKDFIYLKAYQEKYETDRKNKRMQRLKLQKENNYKIIWGTKSIFYKLIHRKLSPKNNDLKSMVFDDIDSLINKLTDSKKR